MTDTIFTFAAPVDCSALTIREITYDEALNLLHGDLWGSCSRGGELLAFISMLLDGYQGFGNARYLFEEISVLRAEQLKKGREAIEGLIAAVRQDPTVFKELFSLQADADEIRQGIAEAKESRMVDAEEQGVSSSIFLFLFSQIAALNNAQQSGRCLIYVRIRP